MDAVDEAARCSSMLMWTYAYGYYCLKNDQKKKQMFEYNQTDIEQFNQKLFKLIEMDLNYLMDGIHEKQKFY